MPKYLVTDGVKYLRIERGNVSFVSREGKASAFVTNRQAFRIFKETIPDQMKDGFFVKEIEEAKGQLLFDLINADTSNFGCWKKGVKNLVGLVGARSRLLGQLVCMRTEIDDEIIDIRHYIEFTRLNAHKGWEAYEMLRVLLVRRRKLKDAISILNDIHGTQKNEVIESAKRAINRLNRRRYKPRRLHFLF